MAAAPAPREFKVAPVTKALSVEAMLRSFGEVCEREGREDLSAVEWGEKVGISVFDEEVVLARGSAAAAKAALPREAFGTGDYREFHIHEHLRQQPIPPPAIMAPVLQGLVLVPVQATEPRSLRLARSLCRIYDLTRDCEDTCPICIEKMASGQVVWRLPCMHQVHQECIISYFGGRRVKPACPLCRCSIQYVSQREA